MENKCTSRSAWALRAISTLHENTVELASDRTAYVAFPRLGMFAQVKSTITDIRTQV